MKKMVSILCAFVMILSLAACGGYTPEMGEAEYKAACREVSYESLSRNPEEYKGTYVKVSGEILQVVENGNNYVLRVSVGSVLNDIYVTYTKKEGEARLLEYDHITIYGKAMGTKTYTTVMNAQRTIPQVYAGYIDLG